MVTGASPRQPFVGCRAATSDWVFPKVGLEDRPWKKGTNGLGRYGRYEKAVDATDDGHLKIGDHRLTLLREKDPARLPWKSMNVDIVFECTGAFTRREELDAHIHAGARYVILSAPSKSDEVETIVHGVNSPQGDATIISSASCTTNCITPVMEVLGRRIGVKKAIMTTVHAYTASQAIVDGALQPTAKRPGRWRDPRAHI
jgi:glyceraldehyde-3-phosphate dehydrogenase type I